MIWLDTKEPKLSQLLGHLSTSCDITVRPAFTRCEPEYLSNKFGQSNLVSQSHVWKSKRHQINTGLRISARSGPHVRCAPNSTASMPNSSYATPGTTFFCLKQRAVTCWPCFIWLLSGETINLIIYEASFVIQYYLFEIFAQFTGYTTNTRVHTFRETQEIIPFKNIWRFIRLFVGIICWGTNKQINR